MSIRRDPSARPGHTVLGLAVAVTLISLAACTPGDPGGAATAGSGPATAATTSAAPGETSPSATPRTGRGFFAGSANVPVAYALPAGWDPVETMFVAKTGADPALGVAFFDIANIYADGCRWRLADPPVGPGVDDLVTAVRKVSALQATPATPVSVDGHRGKQLRFSVPRHDAADCKDGTYALAQADNAGTGRAQEGPPNLWALVPEQQNRLLVLDVDGTRLAVIAMHAPGISTQDRAALDDILGSLRIG